ncbi:MAG: acyltransferase family protein [Polyangiaceae bacterium]
MTAPRYVAALDGMRGIAVLMVLACHFSQTIPVSTKLGAFLNQVFYGGWAGVDAFFVLSGYLITSGLILDSGHGTPRVRDKMRRFYIRRTLRIFPLYYATLLIGSLLSLWFGSMVPSPSFWLYIDNLPGVPGNQPSWTGHLWSLAIEEQFYLMWPAVMLLLPRARARATIALLLACVASRFVILFWPTLDFNTATGIVYRATFGHADGLLAGALVAIVERDRTSNAARVWLRLRVPGLFLLSLAVLIPRFLTVISDPVTRVSWGLEIFVLAYGFAVVVSIIVDPSQPSRLKDWLSARWLVACGRVSYGMYLFHWPLTWLIRPKFRPWIESLSPSTGVLAHVALMPVGALIIFGIAQFSYRFFESPFLRLKNRFAE